MDRKTTSDVASLGICTAVMKKMVINDLITAIFDDHHI